MEWLVGVSWVGFCGMSMIEVASDNGFINVGNEEGGGFGSDLPVDALFEGV